MIDLYSLVGDQRLNNNYIKPIDITDISAIKKLHVPYAQFDAEHLTDMQHNVAVLETMTGLDRNKQLTAILKDVGRLDLLDNPVSPMLVDLHQQYGQIDHTSIHAQLSTEGLMDIVNSIKAWWVKFTTPGTTVDTASFLNAGNQIDMFIRSKFTNLSHLVKVATPIPNNYNRVIGEFPPVQTMIDYFTQMSGFADMYRNIVNTPIPTDKDSLNKATYKALSDVVMGASYFGLKTDGYSKIKMVADQDRYIKTMRRESLVTLGYTKIEVYENMSAMSIKAIDMENIASMFIQAVEKINVVKREAYGNLKFSTSAREQYIACENLIQVYYYIFNLLKFIALDYTYTYIFLPMKFLASAVFELE